MRLNIDGTLGASVAFAESQQHRLAGFIQANGLTWSAHNVLSTPLQCTLLLMGKEVLRQSDP